MKNRCNTQLTEQAALAFFKRHLDSLKWNYHFSKDKRCLYSGFNGENLLWDFSMIARQQDDGVFLLGVNSFIPNKVPSARVAACAELLTRINYSLTLGCFELDYKHSEIRFRTSITLPAEDVSLGIVEHLIRSNLAITDTWFPSITAVLFSGVTPAEAMKPKTESPTHKTEPRFELN